MRLLPIVAGLFVLSRGAPAQVTTFGADLTLPPNVNFDCSVWPIPSPFAPGMLQYVPTGAQSCTWTAFTVGANPRPPRR